MINKFFKSPIGTKSQGSKQQQEGIKTGSHTEVS